ncbi:50S ribosomal protein L35 [Patescibacteria group bacterium]|nr:MAG: 50S ribosomal protein L35 [Patescibacteria group bacterium]
MKLKTHKSLSKRVWRTKTGKVMKRFCGQGHFNSRDTGKMTRKKRRDTELSGVNHKAIDALLPYSK